MLVLPDNQEQRDTTQWPCKMVHTHTFTHNHFNPPLSFRLQCCWHRVRCHQPYTSGARSVQSLHAALPSSPSRWDFLSTQFLSTAWQQHTICLLTLPRLIAWMRIYSLPSPFITIKYITTYTFYIFHLYIFLLGSCCLMVRESDS